METQTDAPLDIFIIGGGINGCGIARDAVGRGYSVGLAEMNDLASATSSASTKLFHGGLRYLEYFEFRLVAEALKERETLLRMMPHISWPMRFVLPYHRDMRFEGDTPTSKLLRTVMPWMRGRRPAWLIRFGLFLYDQLGGRDLLPGTRSLDLTSDPAGQVLNPKFRRAFEYSDCWVDDARLVALNARDAAERGAAIWTRTKVVSATRGDTLWTITLQDQDTGATREVTARALVNAAGPWAASVIHGPLGLESRDTIRLVRGSHVVTRRLFDHDRAYFLQGTDGRIIFAIPYQQDFTLIGTTDQDHSDPQAAPVCTDEERDYLLGFASQYFKTPLGVEDVVWTYSGVRPLYDDGSSSATAATRDYTLRLDAEAAPLLNIFGGKITTYRRLAQAALAKIATVLPGKGGDWTAGAALPGGDFAPDEVPALIERFAARYACGPAEAQRLVRAYGTDAWKVFGEVDTLDAGGRVPGTDILKDEVRWLMEKEFARTAQDVLWRRSKLGLRGSEAVAASLDAWMAAEAGAGTR